jgi:dynein light chain roadblock-type
VLATIVLDRSSGAILKTTGSLASSRVSVSSNASTLNSSVSTSEESSGGSRELQGIEEMAEMAWNFTKSAGELVQGLDIEVGGIGPAVCYRD